LAVGDVRLGTGAHVSCVGKGRRQRVTPLTVGTAKLVQTWMAERPCSDADPLFPARRGAQLCRDGFERRLAKYAAIAARSCPTLAKKRISPHVMRHSAAMRLVSAGVDIATVALWLGHRNVATTSQVYVHADLGLKERALARTAPNDVAMGRYRPPDKLLAFLEGLEVMPTGIFPFLRLSAANVRRIGITTGSHKKPSCTC
jgi:integrase/recombinase XerD